MRRLRPALAGALVVALAGLAWWLGMRSIGVEGEAVGPEREDARHAAGEESSETARGALEGATPALGTAPSRRVEREPSPPPAPVAAPARVHGKVRHPPPFDRKPPEGARVDVRDSTGRLVGRTPLGADWAFALDVPVDPRAKDPRFQVACLVPGHAIDVHVTTLSPGRSDRALLEVKEKGRIEGVVLDPQGRPVPDFEFLIVRSVQQGIDAEIGGDPETEAPLLSAALARVRTGPAGRFAVRGVPSGSFSFRPLDPLHQLWSKGRGLWVTEGDHALELEVRPGFLLEIAVEPPDPRESLGPTTVEFLPDSARVAECRSKRGPEFWISGPVTSARQNGFGAQFAVGGAGLRRVVRAVSFGPGAWRRRVEVRLERIEPERVGTVRLLHEAKDPDGRPLPVFVRQVHDLGAGRSLRPVPLERDADGNWQVRVEPGPVELSIAVHARPSLLWAGTLSVTPGEQDFVVPLPPSGTLRLTCTTPSQAGAELRPLFEREGVEALHLTVVSGSLVVPAVPAGRWRVTYPQGSDVTRIVDVEAGRVTDVEFP